MTDQERLAELVNQLVSGWTHRVEYHVQIPVHARACYRRNVSGDPRRLAYASCPCPVRVEARARTVHERSLISQLTDVIDGYFPVTSEIPGGKPTSRPPGSLDAVELLRRLADYVSNMEGKTLPDRLRALVGACEPETLDAVRRFVKTARILTGHDVPARVLRDTVCGQCGGTLVVAADAHSDVRCIGNDEAESCGMVYRRWEWVQLLDQA